MHSIKICDLEFQMHSLSLLPRIAPFKSPERLFVCLFFFKKKKKIESNQKLKPETATRRNGCQALEAFETTRAALGEPNDELESHAQNEECK